MLALALGCSNVAIEIDGSFGWWVVYDGAHGRLIRLDSHPSGDCPDGCGMVAYPYTIEGSDGYVDAAPACATRLVANAVSSGWLPVKS